MFELIFFTSSRVKTQHAKYLCREFDIKIINFNEVTKLANYEEPRIDDREKLLKESLESAKKQLEISGYSKNRAFIIEDTSVDIHSLSGLNAKETPGVDIKYWMKDTYFIDLDYQLQMLGNNRKVTVRSDLLLWLPSVKPYEFQFIGMSEGSVVNEDSRFDTNVVYPWLDNKTFNKWFQPNGESVSISKLPIEKADLYDFREKAFSQMLSFLYNHHIIKKRNIESFPSVKELFSGEIECHIIVGLTCAGKTTVANYLINECDFLHVEASDFMHETYREHHGIDSEIEIGTFAKEILKLQPTIVSEKVVNYLLEFKPQNLVITGFRLEEEVTHIERYMSDSHQVKRVVISASREIREQRKESRNRVGDVKSTEGLKERDNRELEMGVATLTSHPMNTDISNEGTFEDLFNSYMSQLALSKPLNNNLPKNNDPNKLRLKDLIILALYGTRHNEEKSNYYSTTEICKMVNELGLHKPKFVNNVGRFFSKKISAMFEVEFLGEKRPVRKYRLSNTGAGYAKTLLRNFTYTK